MTHGCIISHFLKKWHKPRQRKDWVEATRCNNEKGKIQYYNIANMTIILTTKSSYNIVLLGKNKDENGNVLERAL